MKDLPFDTVGIDAEEVSTLKKTYKLLKAKFNITLSGNITMHINKFELFNNNPDTVIGGSLIINAPKNTCLPHIHKKSLFRKCRWKRRRFAKSGV